MRHTKIAAAIALATGAMSAAAAHAVGGPGQHGQSGVTHGNTGTTNTHGNDGTHGNSGTHGNNGTHGPSGTHGHNGTHGPQHFRHNNTHSQGCHFRSVAWVAKGVLQTSVPTFQALGDTGKFDITNMSVQFTSGNHFATQLGTIPQPLDLSNVRAVFALSDLQPLDGVVDQTDVQVGDRVQLIGKILWRPARCEPPAAEATTETTDTTGTTGTNAAPTPPATPEPVVRKVIFKDPPQTGGDTTETETTTTATTTGQP